MFKKVVYDLSKNGALQFKVITLEHHIVICKPENHTIIDKIQPKVSRTEIKGTLVFNEGGGGYSDIFIHT